MKTPGLIVIQEDKRICLKHPYPIVAYTRDAEHGDTEDLHDLVEDLERRDFLLNCIYTDDTNPFALWGNTPITYQIIQEKYPSILHHFGECTAPYCPLSRCVDPVIRQSIEELFVKQITQYVGNDKTLDIVVYGGGGFLTELFILTRVVKRLRLTNIRIHIHNQTSNELYQVIRTCKSDKTDQSNITNIDDINDQSSQNVPKNRKTNHFRMQYAKLCAISEWFSATGFTTCEIYLYSEFQDMIPYQFDVFMGIDYIEQCVSAIDINRMKYVSMMSSDLILLAYNAHPSVKVSVIRNDCQQKIRIDDIKNRMIEKDTTLESINKRLVESRKYYRGIVKIEDTYEIKEGFLTCSNIQLLDENESDESVLNRLNNPDTFKDCIIDDIKQFMLIEKGVVFTHNNDIYEESRNCLNDIYTYIDTRFAELNIRDYKYYELFWIVLMTKSFTDGMKMLGHLFTNIVLSILLVIVMSLEMLFGTCRRLITGESSNSMTFNTNLRIPTHRDMDEPCEFTNMNQGVDGDLD